MEEILAIWAFVSTVFALMFLATIHDMRREREQMLADIEKYRMTFGTFGDGESWNLDSSADG